MLGPVSQRVAINRTMDIHRSSMASCVQVAINRSLQLIATLSETGPRTLKNGVIALDWIIQIRPKLLLLDF